MRAFFRSSVFMFFVGQLFLLMVAVAILVPLSHNVAQTTETLRWREEMRVKFEKMVMNEAETKKIVDVLKTKVEESKSDKSLKGNPK